MTVIAPLGADGRAVCAIGLMSGTSADGIDAALVTIREAGDRPALSLQAFLTTPYPDAVRRQLDEGFADRLTTRALCLLDVCLGELFAEAAARVARKAEVALEGIDFIASHGQTVWHQPEAESIGGHEARGTLQLGEPCVIAERTGCLVVADFRSRDMAAGGEGAPLVPYFDYLMLRHPERARAVQNLGGIGNVTYLPAGGGPETVVAFDTGPGNALIDAAMARATGGRLRQDTDGQTAQRGRVDESLLQELLAHPYFRRPPPKSTGKELFGASFVDGIWERCRRTEDLVATLTEFTAASVERSYADWLAPHGPIDEVILCGGGARNPVLVESLRRRLAPAGLNTFRLFGDEAVDAKEAAAFALLGYETLRGRAANLPSATGASRAVILGKIIPGAR